MPGGKLPIVPPSSATIRGPPSRAGNVLQVALEVADHAVDLQPVVLGDELLGGLADALSETSSGT